MPEDCESGIKVRGCRELLIVLAFLFFAPIADLKGQIQDNPSKDLHGWVGSPIEDGHYSRIVLKSMWDGGLFKLAKDHALEQRSRSKPGTDPYALWTLWTLEGLGREAQVLDRSKPEAAASWEKELDDIVDTFVKDPSNKKRMLWVELAKTRCHFMVAQSELANYLATPVRQETRDACLSALRRILDSLDGLQERIKEQISLESAAKAGNKEFAPSRELQELMNESILMEIECFELRGQCYEEKSADCIAAGAQMLKRIEDAKTRIAADWSGRPKLELARASALLLLSDYDKGIRTLNEMKMNLPLNDRNQKVRLLTILASAYRKSGKYSEARTALEEAGDWTASPHVAIERLALQLESLKQAGEGSNASQELQEAIDFKKKIGEQFGGYWLQRAEALLVRRNPNAKSIASNPTNPRNSSSPEKSTPEKSTMGNSPAVASSQVEVQILVTEAKQLIAGKQLRPAIAKLQKAEMLEADAGNSGASFTLGQQAAALMQKEGLWQEASEQYRAAANRSLQETGSSNAHLMSAWVLSEQLAKLTPEQSKKEAGPIASKFEEILREHIAQFPDQSSSKNARQWLDDSLLAKGDLAGAEQVWLGALSSKEKEPSHAAYAAGRHLLRQVVARSWINFESPKDDGYAESSQELERLLKDDSLIYLSAFYSAAELDRRWLKLDAVGERAFPDSLSPERDAGSIPAAVRMALSTLNSSRLGQGPKADAAEGVETLQALGPEWYPLAWPWLDSLHASMSNVSVEDRKKWAPILRALLSVTRKTRIGGPSGSILDARRSAISLRCQSWEGEFEAASKGFENLAAKNRSLFIEFEHAAQLTEQKGRVNDALAIYRKIARSNPGTDPWWESKLRITELQIQAGSKKEASESLTLAKSTYPKMEAKWQSRIEKLLSLAAER